MPAYRYQAKDMDGKTQKGIMDAVDPDDLYTRLKAKSMILLSHEPFENEKTSYKLKLPEVSDFSRQIANMLGSGLTVVRALNILMESDIKPRLKEVYDRLYRTIHNGLTLSEALRICGNSFPRLFVDMIASGEASGQLEKTALKMAEHYEKEYKLNSKIKAASTYPIILLVMTVIIVIVIFTVILPTFFELFKDMELPLVTQIVMSISNALIHYWPFILAATLLAGIIFNFLLSIHSFRREFDKMKVELPVVGKLLRTIYTARFSRAMSSLYSSGLPLINTLSISSTLVGNTFIEDQFPEIVKDVRNGESLSASIRKVVGFDSKLASTIYVGEESGRLVTMLESIAENYDFEADAATTRLVALLEPAMIVVMGLVIGAVMLSVMLPIFTLYKNIG